MIILGVSLSASLVNVSRHHRVYEMYTRFARERKDGEKLHLSNQKINLGVMRKFDQRIANSHVRYVRLIIHRSGKRQQR